jgi:peroxiredoxin family protein
MARHAVILGGGTGGTLAANRLRRHYCTDQRAITVVDQDDRHVYQPGPLFVPFGLTQARAEGIDAGLFFTFFGLDAVLKARHDHIKVATVGNPGLHVATWVGGFPGMSAVMTRYMNHKMEDLDIPSIPEFIEMIADTGAGLYACKASVDPFGLEKNDFIPQVQDIIAVGEFYTKAAGGQIIFT